MLSSHQPAQLTHDQCRRDRPRTLGQEYRRMPSRAKASACDFIRGVSKEPELVRDFAAAKGFELSTDFEEAIADPRVQAVFPGDAAFTACRADFRRGGSRQAGLVRKAAGADARGGRARHRRHAKGRRAVRARQQQALLFLDARAQARRCRRHHRRGACISRAISPTNIRRA